MSSCLAFNANLLNWHTAWLSESRRNTAPQLLSHCKERVRATLRRATSSREGKTTVRPMEDKGVYPKVTYVTTPNKSLKPDGSLLLRQWTQWSGAFNPGPSKAQSNKESCIYFRPL
ncbi:hypothetical protein CRENBAI_022348 [Crenichthys baileyi]|uniref:Uncharacterized protein n=1 Tax=Crenichthys baileyi TaxID=28760 RepID=A0AAV9RLV8_9TELE